MKRTITGLAGLGIVALMTSACLSRDTSKTIYLEPDGTVTWTVVENEVRDFDGKTAEDRAREEAEFVAAFRGERHPVALALGRLDPMSVRTNILRAERPYTVLTQARFLRLDWLMTRFFIKLGFEATSSTLDWQDGTVTWTLTAFEPADTDAAHSPGEDKAVDVLLESFDHCRFVLAAGHFTSAVGFELSNDARVATFQDPDRNSDQASEDTSSNKRLHFSLTWTESDK